MDANIGNSQPKPAQAAEPQPRRGGRIACSFCHTRRVRCDAFESQPCSSCVAANSSCQLIDSKRGRYHRGRKTATSKSHPSGTVLVEERQLRLSKEVDIASPRTCLAGIFEANGALNPGATVAEQLRPISDAEPSSSQTGQKSFLDEGSENLYARLGELRVSTLGSRNLLGIESVYLGESWLLRYVVQDALNAESASDAGSTPSTLQVPVPTLVNDKAENLGHGTHLDPEDLEVLRIRGAFTLPSKDVSDHLIKTFFAIVYPAFPIFDREEFAQLYEKEQVSILILHAIYSLASTLCDEEVIQMAGFGNRNEARKIFLKRAKAIYETDYETNKVAIIQATFIFSFLWNGSNDEKDMWYWLGISTSIAQAKGMHRSTQNSPLRLRDRRLWKRIWWSLYVRDRHCAANIGRPMRICEDDCDVEQLEDSDFDDPPSSVSEVYGRSIRTHVLYAMSMCKLSRIFGSIMISKFPISLSRATASRDELDDRLKSWRQQLPSGFWDETDDENHAFWSKMLELSYNHLVILLHRPEQSELHGNEKSSRAIAFAAANKVTRTVDDLLAMGAMQRTQLQICPSIFASLAMYVLQSRSSDPIQRKLAENKARLLMLGLSEIGKTWPASTWILRLFEVIFKKQQEESQGTSQYPAQNIPPSASRTGISAAMNDNFNTWSNRGHSLVTIAPCVRSDQQAARSGADRGSEDFQWDTQMQRSSLEMSERFEADLLAEFPPNFDVGNQDFFPYLMDFNSFQDV